MKKKWIGFLLTAVMVASAGVFSACKKDGDGAANLTNGSSAESSASGGSGSEWGSVFTVEAAYAKAQQMGYSGTLQEFLASISGADGVGISTIAINADGELLVTLTNGNVVNAGKLPAGGAGGSEGGSDHTCIPSAIIVNDGNFYHQYICSICQKVVLEKHTYEPGGSGCTLCGDEDWTELIDYETGLVFQLNEVKNVYCVSMFDVDWSIGENVVIPETFNGLPVGEISRIGGEIKTLVLSKSVTTILSNAFSYSAPERIYYAGTEAEWNGITVGENNDAFVNANRYYYSAGNPTSSGNYWRYVNGVPTIW